MSHAHRPRLRQAVRPARRLREAPVTVAYLLVFWAAGAAGALAGPGPAASAALAARTFPAAWWTPATSLLVADWPAGYLGGSALMLAAGLLLERRMGSSRFAAAALGGHLAAAVATAGATLALQALADSWTRELAGSYLGPASPACAALAAGSATLPTLWRRRLRTGLFAVLFLLVLYSGSFRDLVCLAAAAAGLLAGPVLAGTRRQRFHPRATVREARVLAAVILAAAAAGPVLAALDPGAAGPLSVLKYVFTGLEPHSAQQVALLCADPAEAADCLTARIQQRAGAGGIFMAALPSILLLVCADGLRRGRRAAWAAGVLVTGAMSVLAAAGIADLAAAAGNRPAPLPGLLDELDFGRTVDVVVPLAVPMVLFAGLLAAARLFPVRAARGSYLKVAAKAGAAGLAVSAAYLAAAASVPRAFDPEPGFGQVLRSLPDRFLPLGYLADQRPGFVPVTGFGVLLYEGVGVLFWTVLALLLLRSFDLPAPAANEDQRRRAAGLLRGSGGGNLSWMASWPGNDYWFSEDGRGFVAYRSGSGIALTLGPPVGPAAELPQLLAGFARFCTRQGLVPCLYSVDARVRDAAAAGGWSSVQVAEETVLPLGSLTFAGRKFQDVRTALNRAEREGIRAEWFRFSQAPLALREQVLAIDEEWVADKDLPEMGFTLGGLATLEDPEVRCLAAVDAAGKVHAVASWLPVYRCGQVRGWTLDYMRRSGSGFRPSMEFLIASAARTLQDEGFEFASLSGAPLARSAATDPVSAQAGNDADKSGSQGSPETVLLEHFLGWLGVALEPVYGFRSLLSFKAKFQPEYLPLYMVYPDPAALPRIGAAVARAYLPELSVRQRVRLVQKLLARRS